jgi:ABC-type uncharacterized transport system substrate-binding protein
MAISELEQGRAAGRLAHAILVEGKFPSALPIRSAVKGRPAINLARAKQLGPGGEVIAFAVLGGRRALPLGA